MANISFFNEKGYLILENILSSSDCDEIIKLANKYNAKKDYVPIMNIHNYSNMILKIMSNSNIIKYVEEIFNGKALGLQTEFFFMPPGTKGFSPHQDNTYVQANQNSFVSVWIALTDVNTMNGGLIIWPESHKEFQLRTEENENTPCVNQDPNARKMKSIIPKKYKATSPNMPKGSIMFIHSWLVHASNNNESCENRNALLCTYIKEGADFRSGNYAKRKSFELYNR